MAEWKSIPGNYEDYLWRKEGGAEKLQETVSRSTIIAQPVNGNKSEIASDENKSKRLNPIKRKQMEERVKELEVAVASAEAAIAECEAGLQTFFSAEETARCTQQLANHRTKLQNHLAEWEELGQALEA